MLTVECLVPSMRVNWKFNGLISPICIGAKAAVVVVVESEVIARHQMGFTYTLLCFQGRGRPVNTQILSHNWTAWEPEEHRLKVTCFVGERDTIRVASVSYSPSVSLCLHFSFAKRLTS